MHVSRGVHGKSLYFLSCFCEPKTCPKTKNQKTLKTCSSTFSSEDLPVVHTLRKHSRLVVAGLIKIYTPGKVVVLNGALKNQSAKRCIKNKSENFREFLR